VPCCAFAIVSAKRRFSTEARRDLLGDDGSSKLNPSTSEKYEQNINEYDATTQNITENELHEEEQNCIKGFAKN
jgi:hypothetical protein